MLKSYTITMLIVNIFDLFWYLHNTYKEADWNSSKTVYKLPDCEKSKKGKANTTQAHGIKSDK